MKKSKLASETSCFDPEGKKLSPGSNSEPSDTQPNALSSELSPGLSAR
jgi:hypothetical protein